MLSLVSRDGVEDKSRKVDLISLCSSLASAQILRGNKWKMGDIFKSAQWVVKMDEESRFIKTLPSTVLKCSWKTCVCNGMT